MRRLLVNLFLLFVLTLYAASLLGMLLIGHAFMFLGIVAFLLMFLVTVLTQGFQKRHLRLKRVWIVIAPLFVVLFVTTIVLSRGLGAPQTENESVFAKRDKYRFTRGGEVSRGRFIAVSVCSTLAWHLLAVGFAAEQWASFRATEAGPLQVKPRPPKRKKVATDPDQNSP
jgi:hypothetical protein